MKHEYSPQQIEEACDLASNGYTRIGINFLLDFLDHLPEPVAEDWQECRFEDIQKGDRVKRVLVFDSGTTDTREGVVANIDAQAASCTHKRILASAGDMQSSIVKLYRIPAPVQRPDPEVNHFIRINGKDYEALPDSGRYQLIESKWSSPMVLNVEHITEWEELELIPKVAEDDR